MRYGSKTKEIEKIINRVQNLTKEDIKDLGQSWNEGMDTQRTYAREYGYRAVNATILREYWLLAKDDVSKVAESVLLAPEVEFGDACWVAIHDAILSQLCKGLITKDNFNLLYNPWKLFISKGVDRI